MSEQHITFREDDEIIVLNYYQDVEPFLKDAADSRRHDAENRTRFGRRAELRRTMTIPNNIMLDVCTKLGVPAGRMFDRDVQQRIMRELKGPDYKLFRTTSDKRI